MTAVVRLAEIEARADAATAGPWRMGRDTNCQYVLGAQHSICETGILIVGDESNALIIADAAFIAAARTDVPWLVDLARRQAAALRAVLKVHSPTWDGDDHVCVADGSRLTDDVPDCPTVRAIVEALGSERP